MAACCGTTNKSSCCDTTTSCCSSEEQPRGELGEGYLSVSTLNTLAFKAALCINCGMCSAVCPHAVFLPDLVSRGRGVVSIVRPDACMECGACQRNCPTGALRVESGVGCAAAMINAALRGDAVPTC
jgi:NAD-dependent dihydropyrimidine dehydrogenase PreA subunit